MQVDGKAPKCMSKSQFARLRALVIRSLPRNLSQPAVRHWSANSEKLNNRLQLALARPNLEVWKTIDVRGYEFDEVLERFKQEEIEVDKHLKEMIQQESFELEGYILRDEEKIDLVRVTPKDLGFRDNSVVRARLDAQAYRLGLRPLPYQGAAITLRLEYDESPQDVFEAHRIRIHPVADSRGLPFLLCMTDYGEKRGLHALTKGDIAKDEHVVYYKPKESR